ncbi:septum formation initiator family protein [Fusibacter paucivorans]|uniref:Septum formation initiator family protein n=1 Tax=Fusibacter paucivorans TaxID=76009 RepID=A0ABS5PPZ4_9FIRM|nr:septum formation initiator family protein [Fusibacter paucivorans]MBS7527249.1 septum formation initiator family protein [Fusibacter paucivorans]
MKRKKGSFIRRNILILMMMCIFSGYFVYNLYTSEIKLQTYEATQAELRAEIESLEKDMKKLNLELEYAQTPEAIEKLAREKLKMVKANEIIYIINGLDE